jgi:ferritin-like metal-binding protein YciE
MKVQSLEELFLYSLQHIFDAERQLTKALPKLAKAATNPELQEAFKSHLAETKQHVQRVEKIFNLLEKKPQGKANQAIEAMSEDADELVNLIEASPVRDAALIMAASQVEHYEAATYASLRSLAQTMGQSAIVRLLEQTLEEEEAAAAKVAELAEKHINKEAVQQAAGVR